MVVVVAEVDSDRARHELLVAYFRWARTPAGASGDQAPAVRGALINDVASLRLGVLPSAAEGQAGLRYRADREVAAWTLVVTIGGSHAVGEDREAKVDERARCLAKELHACGQGRISILGTPRSWPKTVGQLPLVLRCLPATDLVTAWLRGVSVDAALSRASHQVYAGNGAGAALRVHQIGGDPARPWGDSLVVSDGGTTIQPTSLWRIYYRPVESSAAGRDASGGLLDGCRPAFETSGVELAWITPLADVLPSDRIELVGTAHVDGGAMDRVERAFGHADAIAGNLEYQVVQPEPRLPLPLCQASQFAEARR